MAASKQVNSRPTYVRPAVTLNLLFFQMKLWTNLEKLLACKKQCLENASNEHEMLGGTVHIEPGTETLVLQ